VVSSPTQLDSTGRGSDACSVDDYYSDDGDGEFESERSFGRQDSDPWRDRRGASVSFWFGCSATTTTAATMWYEYGDTVWESEHGSW